MTGKDLVDFLSQPHHALFLDANVSFKAANGESLWINHIALSAMGIELEVIEGPQPEHGPTLGHWYGS